MTLFGILGTMISDVSILGAGFLIIAAVMILASMRGISKAKELWLPVGGGIAWLISFMSGVNPAGSGLFIIGSMAIVGSFTQIIDYTKIQRVNLFHLAMIAVLCNLVIGFGYDAYTSNVAATTGATTLETWMESQAEEMRTALGAESTICESWDTNCYEDVTKEGENSNAFDVFSFLLDLWKMVGWVGKFILFASFGTTLISLHILSLVSGINVVLALIIAVFLNMWMLAIGYHIYRIVWNSRGVN